jgi:undecaprenyl-diphosphatase
MSMVFYLTVGIVLARSHERLCVRAYVVGVTALLAVLIGVSRVALGVHWASDVLGGWAFGVAWTLLWCLLVRPDRPGLTHH